jgi:hypothetical protein
MRVITFSAVCFLWATVAAAQTPLGPELLLASLDRDAVLRNAATLACDDVSVCVAVWTSFDLTAEDVIHRWGRIISPLGKLSPLQLLGTNEGPWFLTIPTLPLTPGFILFGQQGFRPRAFGFWIYDEDLQPQSGFIRQPFHAPARYGDTDSISSTGALAAIQGGFVECQAGLDQPASPCDSGACSGVFLYFFDRAGHKLRDRIQVNADVSGRETVGSAGLALDGEGNILVTYYRLFPAGDSRAFVRRFSPAGDPLGPEIAVEDNLLGDQLDPAVAASPDGQFLVAWLNKADPRNDFGQIYARRFAASGDPLGPASKVSSMIPARAAPKVTADPQGNYFVVWSSFSEGPSFGPVVVVRGRLYRHDGRPVAAGFPINRDAFDQIGGMATFAPNGTLTVSYDNASTSQASGEAFVPVIRRYAASPGQEICAVSGPEIRCDLARTGGAAELQLTRGGRPGEVTLFGDVDGDGRDDVCSYFKGKLRCDVGHEGGKPAWIETFGSAGDVPLLADVDGDGRADLCLRRKSLLLCDTAQDGKVHDRTAFGRGGEVPLLGDLDGDHKADFCLVNGSAWDCLLASGQQLHFELGQRGDSPALGDADRDGRADPCVLRPGGRLQCNTRHDGGPPDYTLALNVPAGARLLFGNLDGL